MGDSATLSDNPMNLIRESRQSIYTSPGNVYYRRIQLILVILIIGAVIISNMDAHINSSFYSSNPDKHRSTEVGYLVFNFISG